MRIFGWMADRSACGFYRIALPLHNLGALGHDAHWATKMPSNVAEADVIVGQRVCEPGPTGNWQRLAREGHATLVFECDDDLWHIDPSNRRAHGFYDGERQRRLIDNITVADLVTVSTEPLAELVSEWNPSVVVLPNCVPSWLTEHERPSTERLTIGWAGTPSHARDFGELAKPLRRVLQRHGDTEFHCIGEDYTPRVASPRGVTRYTGWSDAVEDYYRAVDFDIGLAPLRPTPFNDAKSDIKLLEYAALGIPAIVSDTGPYARAVADGAPALTAVDHSDWTARLAELLDDAEARAQLGKAAREWATGRTIEGNAWRWVEAYR